MACGLLCGCSFFSHDTERDYRQVAARVESYDISNTVVKDDGTTEVKTYTTAPVDIYKYDLVQYVSANSESLSQTYGSDVKGAYRYAMTMLVNTELVVNEVDALIDAGLIEWGLTEQNAVKQRVYQTIDSTVRRLANEILDERDEEQIVDTGDSSVSTETTYPIKPETTDDDEEDIKDTEEWQPSLSSYPGLNGDADRRSLESEAMRRFINLLYDNVKDDFRATADDKAKFEADKKAIDDTINTKGITAVYPMIGATHYMYYISGRNIERSQKITALQKYLTDGVSVNNEEVARTYTTTLNEQRSSYSENVSAFDTAMKNNSTVLYYPNTNYFYVKHILLPFTDAQKADVTAYGKTHTEEETDAYRDKLAESIVAYPHVDGEDDKSRPMTMREVLADVRATMLPLEADVKAADLAFDDLIYLYNTDSGAFGNNKGYVVKYKLDDGESETYMQEFADGARTMRDELSVGQVYYEPVVTDYGVHIMYLASVTQVGEVSLYDYTTPGEVETYYDLLEAPKKTALENAAYQKWEAETLTYNFNKHATLYEKRYSDLWK